MPRPCGWPPGRSPDRTNPRTVLPSIATSRFSVTSCTAWTHSTGTSRTPRIETGQDAAKGVFRGDAIGQVQVAGKPVPAVYGKLMNPSERIGTAKNTADGHEDDVDERCFRSARFEGLEDPGNGAQMKPIPCWPSVAAPWGRNQGLRSIKSLYENKPGQTTGRHRHEERCGSGSQRQNQKLKRLARFSTLTEPQLNRHS